MLKALITGVTGQDGSRLTELLLERDYEVHGIAYRIYSFTRERGDHLCQNLAICGKSPFLHYGDRTHFSRCPTDISLVLDTTLIRGLGWEHLLTLDDTLFNMIALSSKGPSCN